jgi:hypothetical protein
MCNAYGWGRSKWTRKWHIVLRDFLSGSWVQHSRTWSTWYTFSAGAHIGNSVEI